MSDRKILYTATVIKTHVMQFHLPYIQSMHDRGWRTAVAGKNDYENPDDCQIPNCDEYFNVPFARNPLHKDNLRAYRQLKEIIDSGSFRVIHCHTPVGGILTRLAARRARKQGTKVFYTAHGFHFFKGAPLKNWLLYFPAEWLCAFFTDVLITINREDYAFAQKHMHAKRVVYLPGVGVDTSKLGISRERRAEIRQRLGVGEDDFFLLSVAELTPNKNHSMVLDALAILRNPHIRFISAGRGECMEAMLEKTKQLNLTDTVSFLGYRSDAKELYAAADAFVFPSFREGLSLALMEAMASGLPAIVGKIRGNTDLISDGVEGIYTPLTAEGLAKSIDRMYRDADLRRRCGEAAKQKVQTFSLENVLAQMDDLYRQEGVL